MAGVLPYTKIVRDLRAQCPHCGKPLDLKRYPEELFFRIAIHFIENDKMTIPRFGKFYTSHYRSQYVGFKNCPDGMRSDGRILRFKPIPALRRAFNGKMSGDRRIDKYVLKHQRKHRLGEDHGQQKTGG